ncbi:hypothetical protein ACWD4L_12600 [Streptomyces sp. NPDC002596]
MAISEFIATVWKMLHPDSSPGPRSPVVLEAPKGTGFAELVEAVGCRAGQPRQLISGGLTVSAINERTGLPLVEPFGEELRDMHGWPYWSHWIGCGQVHRAGQTHSVVVVADRADPAAAGIPDSASWTEKLRLLTGWEPIPRPAVDWPATEAALGTPLPSDYKEVVDLFGPGSFDWYLELLVPGVLGMDLVDWAKGDAAHATHLWRPHSAYPAPQGLLRWGTSEQELDFVWQTGAPDPDDWPVLVRTDFGEWERFDCGVGEFTVGLLTDVRFGFPTSRIAAHCFLSQAPHRP